MKWMRDIGRFAALGPARWRDLLIAVAHLAQARLRLRSQLASALARSSNPTAHSFSLSDFELRVVDRVGFALTRTGPRLPWRADCLVQAFAAQQWLARYHIASRLVIGARRGPEGFAAHAWLLAGDAVVTGGDIGSYTALTAAERLPELAFD